MSARERGCVIARERRVKAVGDGRIWAILGGASMFELLGSWYTLFSVGCQGQGEANLNFNKQMTLRAASRAVIKVSAVGSTKVSLLSGARRGSLQRPEAEGGSERAHAVGCQTP